MAKETLSPGEYGVFCLELSLFLKAGANAAGALELLAEEQVPDWLANRFRKAADCLYAGGTLSDAMVENALLPPDAIAMLRVGERTGRLEDTLRSLAIHYDKKEAEERAIRAALLYPSILLVVMLAVIVVLLVRVLPIFSSVYASLGTRMTGIAGGLFAFGQVLDGMLPLLLVLMGILAVAMILFSTVPNIRQQFMTGWQKRFGISKVATKLHTARFAQGLYMALASGLDGEEAVSVAGALLGEQGKAKCDTCLTLLAEGRTLSEAVRDASLLPPVECRLLSLGATSGSEEAAAEEIADRLAREAEDALSRQISRIEPVLVIVTSLLVGMILLTVMLPLSQIMTTIG